jgi:poly(hydroxyalkanoate) depolymerase family esterase
MLGGVVAAAGAETTAATGGSQRPLSLAFLAVLVVLFDLVGAVTGTSASHGASGLERRTFAGTAGSRDYEVYRPPGGGEGRPLIVYLHGCDETADDAVHATGYTELAAREGFVVVFPQQDPEANSLRCWNWFRSSDQTRDAGEPALIAGITRTVLAEEGSDPRRVYVAGLSAGAAMAVVMGATYPDLFAAVASVAGCEYRGLPCTLWPADLAPELSGRYAYEAMGPRARPVPVLVVQGDADRVVPPANADLLVRQWLETADLAFDGRDDGPVPTEPARRRQEATSGGYSYEVATWNGPDGGPLVERWLVAGLGHAYPGGPPDGAYTDPRGPDATAGAWRFFQAHPGP